MSRIPEYRVQGSGSVLIYIAGLDGTGELLFKQLPELGKRFRVVTYRSREGRSFSYDDLTDDVAAIISNLGESRAVILGESFGGTVALNFALRHKAMVERLVIVNSFPRFRGRARIKLATIAASGLSFRVVTPFRILASSLGLYIDGVTSEDRRRFFQVISTVREEGYAQRLRLISDLNVESQLGEITAPVLFLAATRDIVVPSVREAKLMAQRTRNATIKIVPGAGHACLMGNRVKLAELLEEWSLSAPSRPSAV